MNLPGSFEYQKYIERMESHEEDCDEVFSTASPHPLNLRLKFDVTQNFQKKVFAYRVVLNVILHMYN